MSVWEKQKTVVAESGGAPGWEKIRYEIHRNRSVVNVKTKKIVRRHRRVAATRPTVKPNVWFLFGVGRVAINNTRAIDDGYNGTVQRQTGVRFAYRPRALRGLGRPWRGTRLRIDWRTRAPVTPRYHARGPATRSLLLFLVATTPGAPATRRNAVPFRARRCRVGRSVWGSAGGHATGRIPRTVVLNRHGTSVTGNRRENRWQYLNVFKSHRCRRRRRRRVIALAVGTA